MNNTFGGRKLVVSTCVNLFQLFKKEKKNKYFMHSAAIWDSHSTQHNLL